MARVGSITCCRLPPIAASSIIHPSTTRTYPCAPSSAFPFNSLLLAPFPSLSRLLHPDVSQRLFRHYQTFVGQFVGCSDPPEVSQQARRGKMTCAVGGLETVAEIVLPRLNAKYSAKDQTGTPAGTPRRVEHIEGFFDCGPREVHPWQRPAMPSQETLQRSANYPVLVTPNPMAAAQVRRKKASYPQLVYRAVNTHLCEDMWPLQPFKTHPKACWVRHHTLTLGVH